MRHFFSFLVFFGIALTGSVAQSSQTSRPVLPGEITFGYFPDQSENVQSVKLLTSQNGFDGNNPDSKMQKQPDGSFRTTLHLQEGELYFTFMINDKWIQSMTQLKGKMMPEEADLDEGFGSALLTVSAKAGDKASEDFPVIKNRHKSFAPEVIDLSASYTDDGVVLEWELPEDPTIHEIQVLKKQVKANFYNPQFTLEKTIQPTKGSAGIDMLPLEKAVFKVRLVSSQGELSKGKDIACEMPHPQVSLYEVEERGVYVYLPPGYDEEENKAYPVAYMLDGQNLFSAATGGNAEWRVDEVLDSLITHEIIEPVIVAGIFNSTQRGKEYIPFTVENYNNARIEGDGKAHGKWIVSNVIPFMEANFRAKPGRENRAIFGNSLGGLISLWMMLYQQDVFAYGASISPAAVEGIIPLVKKAGGKNVKIWIDTGEDEEGGYLSYMEQAREIVEILDDKGFKYGKDLFYYEVPGVPDHREEFVSERIAQPFICFFGKEKPEPEKMSVYIQKTASPVKINTLVLNPVLIAENGFRYSLLGSAKYDLLYGRDGISIGEKGVTNLRNPEKDVVFDVEYKGLKSRVALHPRLTKIY
ncbi:MAG: alpha/beta hydrolase-fold protein [Bacteroidota bacterium]